ncbi:MAG: toxin-activating lysine-acyltransferase [Hyphomicrobiaceae bacterium]|nr:toxin-activating lysine-acyltransferase [Hyphomicrobiaceae bacterium]
MMDGSNGSGALPPGGLPPGSSPFNRPAPEGAGKKVSEVLGEITWLMSQSPLHKQFFISDLEWFVMTPVMLQQFRLFYDETKPIGVVFWAEASSEVAQMLANGTTKLRPQDWKSGSELWVVEAVAPFGGADVMVADLKQRVFPAREMRFVAVGAGGVMEVKVV